jgi:DnaJ-class molecular chaperone
MAINRDDYYEFHESKDELAISNAEEVNIECEPCGGDGVVPATHQNMMAYIKLQGFGKSMRKKLIWEYKKLGYVTCAECNGEGSKRGIR